ncbi:DUF883 C-terminal domain-containing protein [Afifella sp. IM 167]|uniref:DUF883 C-terminal domain-containing protein n=1 Tax=Afifella sp. IM 167 TaxID=2033586 RepID=UPI001CCBFCC9|nr:DUF883 C-terminal domain-containing protein [Afifella sp. IM 167]MBZ8132107.1 hypothetical protein [Afifella sp. IM 167]
MADNSAPATGAAVGGKGKTETEKKADALGSDLNREFETLKADVAELSTRISDLLRTGAREGKEVFSERADHYRREGKRQADAALAEAQALTDDFSQSISRNPLTAVLIAVGLGFLIGAISRR